MSRNYDPCEPVAAGEVDVWHDEADVIVVGFGGAGACAALEAAHAGGQVIVMELASASGGTTALAGGQIYLGGGTPIQKACGFDESVDNLYRYLLRASGPNADEAKVRAYCDGSLGHFDWLVGQGVEFNPEFYAGKHTNTPEYQSLIYSGNELTWPERELTTPVPRGHKAKAFWEDGGSTLMRVLTEALGRTSAKVFYDTRVLTTIMDGHRVVGVIARIDGEVRAVKARRGVILTAGGFIMNQEMVARYAPRLTRLNTPAGNPGDTGSGILMGLGAGGATVNMHEGFVCLPFYPPGDFCKGVFVNRCGQRFVSEDAYHGRVAHFCLEQPDGKVYMVVDSSFFEKPPLYAEAAIVEAGETIEELERDAGFPEGTLTATMAVYNVFAARGEDPLFHKSPDYLQPLVTPPYALLDFSVDSGVMYTAFTFGGLDTRVTGEVVNATGHVISGLYAAGRTAAGVPRSGEGYCSGMSIGDATFSGRQAGRAAAAAEAWPA